MSRVQARITRSGLAAMRIVDAAQLVEKFSQLQRFGICDPAHRLLHGRRISVARTWQILALRKSTLPVSLVQETINPS
mgnify:CR=1 FL=1